LSRVFADTSALYAVLVANDASHVAAARTFRKLAATESTLVCTSYVLVETYALLGRRIGVAAVREFRNDFAPLLDIVWVDAALHERGLDWLLEHGPSTVSLVDAVSFVLIRRQQIDEVFAYDQHFRKEGFHLL
jgi:predicted nucleic acid-binding protein